MTLCSPPTRAAEAFDLLHIRHAAPLFRQTFLLCGRRRTAHRAVERAFRLAWERWPEVAADRDPVGWLRAAAYESALSPWWRVTRRRADAWARATARAHPGPPRDRALLEAVLRLPPSYRRSLVLHDAVGLSLAATAAEVEASTPATAGRVVRAREVLAGWLPPLAGVRPEHRGRVLRELLSSLAAAQPVAPGGRGAAAAVRAASERATRRVTRGALAWVALAVGTIALAALRC